MRTVHQRIDAGAPRGADEAGFHAVDRHGGGGGVGDETLDDHRERSYSRPLQRSHDLEVGRRAVDHDVDRDGRGVAREIGGNEGDRLRAVRPERAVVGEGPAGVGRDRLTVHQEGHRGRVHDGAGYANRGVARDGAGGGVREVQDGRHRVDDRNDAVGAFVAGGVESAASIVRGPSGAGTGALNVPEGVPLPVSTASWSLT